MKCRHCRILVTPAQTGRTRRYCSVRCRMAAYRRRERHRRHRLAVHFSSRTCEWGTPPDFFAVLDARFGPFSLDPCATAENAKCTRYFTQEDDGLSQEWTGRVFANPPYGRPLGLWVKKAWESAQTTAEIVVCLVPARTDTAWWHAYAMRGEIELLPGRLRFGSCPNAAPFPSAVLVFRNAKMGAASVTKLAFQEAS